MPSRTWGEPRVTSLGVYKNVSTISKSAKYLWYGPPFWNEGSNRSRKRRKRAMIILLFLFELS